MTQVIHTPLYVRDVIAEQKSNREVSEGRHVGRAVLCSNSGAVLCKHHVLSVVKLVLNIPVRAIQGEQP